MKRFLHLALITAALTPAIALANQNDLSASSVLSVQQALNAKGYNVGRPDGHWGPRTSNAVRRFQQKNQLSANGSLDTNTLNQLGVSVAANNDANTSTSTSGSRTRSNTSASGLVNSDTGVSVGGAGISANLGASADSNARAGAGSSTGSMSTETGVSGSVNQ